MLPVLRRGDQYAVFMLEPRIRDRQVVATEVRGRPTVKAGPRGPEPLMYLAGMHHVVVSLDDGASLVYSIPCPGQCEQVMRWAESQPPIPPSS